MQTIRLTGPAPAGGIDVSITASDVVYTNSAGPSVHVPAGATSVSFPLRLSAPPADVVRSLWAQMSGTPLIKVAEVTVLAADPSTRAVAELRFDPGAAVVGTTTTGTVTLKQPAPLGGIAVDLWSNTSYGPNVYVPPYVVVEAGRTTATFPATITGADSPAVVRPSADLGTSRVVAPLVAVPTTFALGAVVVRPGTEGETCCGHRHRAEPGRYHNCADQRQPQRDGTGDSDRPSRQSRHARPGDRHGFGTPGRHRADHREVERHVGDEHGLHRLKHEARGRHADRGRVTARPRLRPRHGGPMRSRFHCG
ncbi:hypothetical protein [Dactylosporangium matsuzakiense]|uniref:hypothetical protein n=1 Tax=Dactylosporangium matsuzakiense TaxID=53360 RepID=UPI0022F338F3|nr:hypothetical protein [Dactylosporangium matsuzakiense]